MKQAGLFNVNYISIHIASSKVAESLPSKKRESEQRKERELFSWHSPFPLGGESERTFFAFFTLVSRKHTLNLTGRRLPDKQSNGGIVIL
jgi:hypothetical protein